MKKFLILMLVLFTASFILAQDGQFTLNGIDQQGLYNVISSLKGAIENKVLNSPGLAIGSTSTECVLIANTTNFTIDGVFYAKTTAEIPFTATTHDFTAAAGVSYECYFVYSVNSSGTVTVTKGEAAPLTYGVLPDYADIPEDEAIIGYIKIIIQGGSTFDATTTALSPEGAVVDSVTYYNTSILPKLIGPKKPKVTVDFIQQ